MKTIYVEKVNNFKQVAYVEEGELVEFYVEKEEEKSLVGNIYRGRVVDVLKGMNSAFIDIGEEKNAYLSLKDALPKDKIYDKKNHKISEFIKSGSEIIVQVKRDSFEEKGAKVSTHIELSGKYIVFNPSSSRISVSRKIKEKSDRERLKNLASEIIENNNGMILRTICKDIDFKLIGDEYKKLSEIHNKILKEINFLPCPKLVYKNLNEWEKKIRDNEIDKIVVNTEDYFKGILEINDQYNLDLEEKINLDLGFSLKYDNKLRKDLKKALNRTILLKSGASIVIDEAEALTAIDVNTKKYTGSLKISNTILKTNIDAAKEICKQVRLRNIGGIIIIDFIRMENKKHIKKVLEVMESEIAKDHIQTDIIGMTKLGLLEITRKKKRKSLSESILRDCNICKGTGKSNIMIDN